MGLRRNENKSKGNLMFIEILAYVIEPIRYDASLYGGLKHAQRFREGFAAVCPNSRTILTTPYGLTQYDSVVA